jgi:hypothetical protein
MTEVASSDAVEMALDNVGGDEAGCCIVDWAFLVLSISSFVSKGVFAFVQGVVGNPVTGTVWDNVNEVCHNSKKIGPSRFLFSEVRLVVVDAAADLSNKTVKLQLSDQGITQDNHIKVRNSRVKKQN